MAEITIQESTFERLQRHAKPLVDTSDMVINRALDALEQLAVDRAPDDGYRTKAERQIDPRMLPSLTHTKILSASIGGEAIARPNWNRLLDEILRRAMKRVGSFEKLRRLCPVNLVEGRKEDEGYSYISDIDVSVQGQDANGACRAVLMAAQGLGISVDIGFMWRLKEGAAYPGETARVQVGSRSAVRAARQLEAHPLTM
jgi:hypothetical protein